MLLRALGPLISVIPKYGFTGLLLFLSPPYSLLLPPTTSSDFAGVRIPYKMVGSSRSSKAPNTAADGKSGNKRKKMTGEVEGNNSHAADGQVARKRQKTQQAADSNSNSKADPSKLAKTKDGSTATSDGQSSVQDKNDKENASNKKKVKNPKPVTKAQLADLWKQVKELEKRRDAYRVYHRILTYKDR
ncbi:unnamed protein product [Periconia digitata]|uniref:Uncharacterized protein n=1 Tax=Periconia digitata TaxID=1303443 RepID=A0A9W4U4E2_9PLEO|nr:unnamed protein product [Periconia digitata]